MKWKTESQHIQSQVSKGKTHSAAFTFNLIIKAHTFSDQRAKSSYCNAVTFSDWELGFDRILETCSGAQQPTKLTGWYVKVCLDEPDKISCVALVSRGTSTSLVQCSKIWKGGWSVVWLASTISCQNIHQDSTYINLKHKLTNFPVKSVDFNSRCYVFWSENELWRDDRAMKWSPTAHWTEAPICQGPLARAKKTGCVCVCVCVSCSVFLIIKLLQLEVT